MVTTYTNLWAVPTKPGHSRVFNSGFATPFVRTSLWDVIKAIGSPKFKFTLGR